MNVTADFKQSTLNLADPKAGGGGDVHLMMAPPDRGIFMTRCVKGVAFVNKRYTKGVGKLLSLNLNFSACE